MIWRSSAAHSQPVRSLHRDDLDAALELCAQDPVAAVLAAARLQEHGVGTGYGAGAVGAFEDEELTALIWTGANLVPVSPTGRGLGALSTSLLAGARRYSSVVGDRSAVHTVWSHLAAVNPPPRQVRDQPSLSITGTPLVASDPLVRPARVAEVSTVLPASVAMFTEEYGYSPLSAGSGYALRVRQLVELGRSFVRIEPDGAGNRVVFKAEIGAFALGVAQIQGVWVAPDRRGEGLGASGTAAVVEHAFALGAHTVSLYVNDYNAPARRIYRRVGFDQVGSYATIVL